MSNLVRMTVPGNPEYIELCKNAAITAASLSKFDIDAVYEIGIAVSDACKLITCHGSTHWCDKYDMSIQLSNNQFIIEILASGKHNVDKGGYQMCFDCPREGDLSLSVIKSIMDTVEVKNNDYGTKKIIMVKNLC